MNKKTWIVGAVAAMLATTAGALKAQDATTPPPAPAVTPTAVTPSDVAASIPAPPTPMPTKIDYSVLNSQSFDYLDLKQAKARGLTDSQVASVATIAERTGQPFDQVVADIQHGDSFSTLATRYNLDLSDVYNVDDEKQKIADYKAAYETTGTYAMKSMMMGGMAMPASNTPPAMTPPVTTTSATPPVMATPTDDIVGVASSNPQLSTLVQAIQAAGLADTLKGPGPFTVFAPTNRAFRRLPKGALNALLADPTALKNVLLYHVISGQKIDAATAMSMTSPTSPPTADAGGDTLNVTTSKGKVHINNATVTKADIQATNGVIHIIDHVLMPPTTTTPAAGGTMPAPAPGTTGMDNGGGATPAPGTPNPNAGTPGTAGTAGTGGAGTTNGTGTGTDGK